MPKKNFGVEKESDGVVRQKFRTEKYTPQGLKKQLDRPGQLKEVKKRYDIIMATDEELQPCVLSCKGCRSLLSAVNPLPARESNDAAQLQMDTMIA